MTTNCGRVSSLPLGGGLRKKCTLVQPWPASQTRFGTSSTAAIATASGKPRERSTSRRQTRNVAISRTRTTASVYFVSSPTPDGDSEQRPRAASEREPQREPEDDHRRQLVERDRLEEQVRREHPRREPDQHRRERLRAPRRAELAGDERADQHRSRAREDRERAQPDERPAEQLSGERRKQRRHRRELDVAALKVQAGDRVVQLVAVPAVPSGDGELQRALQRDDDGQPGRPRMRRSSSLRADMPRPVKPRGPSFRVRRPGSGSTSPRRGVGRRPSPAAARARARPG